MKIDSSFLFDIARDMYSNLSYWNNNGKTLMPLRYILELTYRCNLSCPFCYLGTKRQLNELDENEWINVIKQIPAYSFISFLGGEIFIRPDFLNIFKFASRKVAGKVNLYTNGTLLSDDKIDELLTNKFLLFSASLDGIGNKHDSLRQKEGAYDKTLNSMLTIKEKKEKTNIRCLK